MSIEQILEEGFNNIDSIIDSANRNLDFLEVTTTINLCELEKLIRKDIDNSIFCVKHGISDFSIKFDEPFSFDPIPILKEAGIDVNQYSYTWNIKNVRTQPQPVIYTNVA